MLVSELQLPAENENFYLLLWISHILVRHQESGSNELLMSFPMNGRAK